MKQERLFGEHRYHLQEKDTKKFIDSFSNLQEAVSFQKENSTEREFEIYDSFTGHIF